jgi:hypothetical protein
MGSAVTTACSWAIAWQWTQCETLVGMPHIADVVAFKGRSPCKEFGR